MKRDPVVPIVVGLLVSLMLLFGVYKSRRSVKSAAAVGKSAGKLAPDFALKSLDGQTIHLSDFKGKGVLVNFWATDCVPCQIETPWLVELQQEYGAQGLQILGVDTYDGGSQKDVAEFAKKMAIDYPILVGKDSEIDAVANAYGGIAFLPQTFVVSRDGKIVGRILGLESKSEIEIEIKKALTEAPVLPAQRALFPASFLASSLVRGAWC